MQKMWSTKRAKKERCEIFVKRFGVVRTMMPYLPSLQQIKLQALNRWNYKIGVARSSHRSLTVAKVLYFPDPCGASVLELWSPKNWQAALPKDKDDGRWLSVQFTRD